MSVLCDLLIAREVIAHMTTEFFIIRCAPSSANFEKEKKECLYIPTIRHAIGRTQGLQQAVLTKDSKV